MKPIVVLRIVSVSFFAGLLLFSTGCVSTAYQPDISHASSANTTASQARQQLQAALQEGMYKKEIRVSRDGFQIFYPHDPFGAPIWWDGGTFSYRFKNLDDAVVVRLGVQNIYRVKGINVQWNRLESAEAFADALNVLVLKSKGIGQDADFERFKQKAAAWRALVTKPPLPDEAHKYLVLAANAVQEKRFADASDYYEQGLEICPLWPDAQHDVAMIDGELGNYGDAAFHMRCYVELVPGASDAEAARNQVIIWDEKAKEPSSSPSEPFAPEPANTIIK